MFLNQLFTDWLVVVLDWAYSICYTFGYLMTEPLANMGDIAYISPITNKPVTTIISGFGEFLELFADILNLPAGATLLDVVFVVLCVGFAIHFTIRIIELLTPL